MKCLVEDKYVYNYRLFVDSKIVKDIFWAYLDSIKLFKNSALYPTYFTHFQLKFQKYPCVTLLMQRFTLA